MSWELASVLLIVAVVVGGFAWYERTRPTSQVVALVAALAALAIAGRIAFAAFPNVKPTTDIVVFAGFALGPAPGFAVGALTALVSNLWFGQGPWTPWQMAGWGMCGILGAALGLRGREPSRFTLAAVCGFAGIAYGALLNFSLMATYGGELSVERFLVLESRAIPFDLAHATGNVVLALVAGPAMVRMLVRFRERFEWRVPAVASALFLLMLAVPVVLPTQAQAADTGRAVSWLLKNQNADGGWGPSTESGSSPETTAWVVLGLEATGRNPLDVSRGGSTPVDFLRANVGDLGNSGDFARTILALEGASLDPRSFGGRNLVEALLNRRRANGSYEGWPGSTAFAAIALRTAGATGGLDNTLSWLAKVQNDDGGWGDVPGGPSTADGTGAVMQAMPHTKPGIDALEYLRKAQRPNGGFPLGGSGSVNSQSTAWAVQGMIAVGEDPATVRAGGDSALDYLTARQAADGHFSYSSSSDQTPVWVTGQVLAAVAGHSFPVPVAQRQPQPSKPQGGLSGTAPGTLTPPPPASAIPPSAGTIPPSSGLPEGFTPAPGGGAETPPGAPPAGGIPAFPGAPLVPGPEGAEPEADPAAPPFEASEGPGPEPWAPLGIGLGTGGLALGSVLFFGRRFGW
ncbi:MAG TPA: prenyltransferase/squalene oxidase repeat-containing protein [Solirubrobacterales bacterium]|nr:prenyltransferase/squalene oxidase repeat-containing protein [Solirubrobacterales bacterium]